MIEHTFAGFGFGPIQAGLFAKEAFQSGNFKRIVVAEIDQTLVDAIRANNGTYYVNVATAQNVETLKIDNVELLNPTCPQDATRLQAALAQATEIATCLPSIDFYCAGQTNSIAALMAEALRHHQASATIVYAAENNNHAAEVLQEAVTERLDIPLPARVQFLNTVIGKMSRVVDDPREIDTLNLAPMAPGIDRAFLVEEFNHILATKATIPDFAPGIEVFIEKSDLLPFEEAKLYGHNAIHALLGFLGTLKGHTRMTDLKDDETLMGTAREAFLCESGGVLVKKYAAMGDELFTEPGYRHFAEDLLTRMTNPHLADTTARASRDIVRKLGPSDRIFGTMSLALQHGIEPKNMALGAMAGVALLVQNADAYDLPEHLHGLDWRALDPNRLSDLFNWLWQGKMSPSLPELIEYTHDARNALIDVLDR